MHKKEGDLFITFLTSLNNPQNNPYAATENPFQPFVWHKFFFQNIHHFAKPIQADSIVFGTIESFHAKDWADYC